MRSGRVFDVLHPRSDDICLEDLAAGLAAIVRFRGALGTPYTVAQHSVLVSMWRGLTLYERRWALLHDAAEAYMGDIPSPVKKIDAIRSAYAPLEARVLLEITRKYGVAGGTDCEVPAAVKAADYAMMSVEVECFRVNPRWDVLRDEDPARWERWWGPVHRRLVEAPSAAWAEEIGEVWERGNVWDYTQAEQLWLTRAEELGISDPFDGAS